MNANMYYHNGADHDSPLPLETESQGRIPASMFHPPMSLVRGSCRGVQSQVTGIKEDKIPESSNLSDKKLLHLVDAGLEINTPYPLVLPPHRKVDLILSFDFSLGDPFETLKRTADYCKDNRIPFPVNTRELYEDPPTKSCYVFEGDGNETPDVMHFPLFNAQTCGEAEKIHRLIKKYAARVPSYDTCMMNELLDIAKKNVESNMGEIQAKIQQCVWRSNQRETCPT
ncbi:cytosolic phospholipase A2 gamma-like [Lithobates pipiens]